MGRCFQILAAVSAAAVCSCVSAQELVATVSLETSPDAGGRLRYEYLIENSADSELTINAFVLDVADGADVESLEHPEGWFGEYLPEEPSFDLAWVAEGPQFEIPIGGSGMFSFTSPFAPGPIFYYLANLTVAGDEVGAILEFIDGPAIAPEGIPGDYNGNGLVEQQDLDLVLANWGEDGTTPPPTWVNDPPEGTIDQPELDAVLVNWGDAAEVGAAAAIPEPASSLLAIACGIAALFVAPRAARSRRPAQG